MSIYYATLMDIYIVQCCSWYIIIIIFPLDMKFCIRHHHHHCQEKRISIHVFVACSCAIASTSQLILDTASSYYMKSKNNIICVYAAWTIRGQRVIIDLL